MGSRQLILTADDLGRTPDVNAAIARYASVLTRAGLMVNEPAAAAAVAWARTQPALQVGLHLTLCDGLASDGSRMAASPAAAGLRFAFFPGARAWLAREVEAQFASFRALGLAPAYWDGHTHLHLHPVVFRVALPVALRHGFRATRLVREPGPPSLLAAVFQTLSRRAAPCLEKAGVQVADRVFGLRKSGRMDLAELRRALAHARSGVTEIYFHPGAEAALPEPGKIAELLEEWRG